MQLTSENYTQGFLVDEELMGGITQHPDAPGQFVAFVVNHLTGEYLAYQRFPTLQEALDILSQVQRPWKFEKVSGGCGGGGGCGGSGGCGSGGGGCGGKKEGHSHSGHAEGGCCGGKGHAHGHDHDHGHDDHE